MSKNSSMQTYTQLIEWLKVMRPTAISVEKKQIYKKPQGDLR